MNKTAICMLALAGAAAMSSPAFAQNSASATASGSVTIIRPIELTKDVDLVFGRIVKPASGSGSVAIADTADTVSATGAVALSGITTSRAKFTINGEGGQSVSVTVPASFSLTNGTDSIAVTLDPDLGASTTLSNALGAAGSKSLYVGGSFAVGSGLSTGAYTGSFNVSVAYE